ncbi:hypothetical protein OLY31_07500, partial [Campylobacter jejuni]|nr:hypothetical protein [Campylobacter jejuni]
TAMSKDDVYEISKLILKSIKA